MKKLVMLFLISFVQGICAMAFHMTHEIKKNMKDADPYITLHPHHQKPCLKDCKFAHRILIAQVMRVGYRNWYVRFDTDHEIEQLVNQIPETNQMHEGEIWSIRWYHYDYPTVSAADDGEFKDAKTTTK